MTMRTIIMISRRELAEEAVGAGVAAVATSMAIIATGVVHLISQTNCDSYNYRMAAVKFVNIKLLLHVTNIIHTYQLFHYISTSQIYNHIFTNCDWC